MQTVKVAYVQWPDGLMPEGSVWDQIRRNVDASGADVLVTNEMPFSNWLPENPKYEERNATRWVSLHEKALSSLSSLQVGAVISSRPVISGAKLANEAFVLENGRYRYVHHKKYFPQERGFYEESWFERGKQGFEAIQVGNLRVGVLLCRRP
ncbi:hypothetical protein PQQ88_33240 [Paraburkholderia caledonica]|uniref:hypothetical protein n=1 Tax=Paraburkholderia caledonica TaxID=134536 RepID=UPI0038BA3395